MVCLTRADSGTFRYSSSATMLPTFVYSSPAWTDNTSLMTDQLMPTEPVTLLLVVLVVLPLDVMPWLSEDPELQLTMVSLTRCSPRMIGRGAGRRDGRHHRGEAQYRGQSGALDRGTRYHWGPLIVFMDDWRHPMGMSGCGALR